MKKFIMFLQLMPLIYLTQVSLQVPSLNKNQMDTPPSNISNVPRINAKSAFTMFKTGRNLIIVDANPHTTYSKYHILGAINLPNDGPKDINRIRGMKLPFPKDKDIIVY